MPHPPAPIRRRQTKKVAGIVQQLLRGEVIVEVRVLRKVADTGMNRDIIQGATEELREARRGKDQPRQNLQRCALTGPVWTQQAEDLAGLDTQTEAIENPLGPAAPKADGVVFGKSPDVDDCHRSTQGNNPMISVRKSKVESQKSKQKRRSRLSEKVSNFLESHSPPFGGEARSAG